MIELEQRGDVWVLAMRSGENRFNRESMDALHGALDQVEQVEGPVALVTTGEGKFYSNGLDLDWLMAAGATPRGSSTTCTGCSVASWASRASPSPRSTATRSRRAGCSCARTTTS